MPSPLIRAHRVETCICQAREGVGQALQRGQSLWHHLHTSCTASDNGGVSVVSLLGTLSHLLRSQRGSEGWSKCPQPFWEGDPSWTKHCPAQGSGRAEH